MTTDGKHIKAISGEKSILSGTGPNRLKKNQVAIEKEGSTYRLAFRDEQNEYRTTAFPGEIIGVTGPQGFTGLSGPTGVQGVIGPIGVKGATGDQGVRGFQGDQGIQGETGLQGFTGHGGVTGLRGLSFEADEVGDLDEAKVTSIESTSGASPIDPFYYAVTDDLRSNQNLPAGIAGDMSLRLAMYAGTPGDWVDWGHYIGTPDVIHTTSIFTTDLEATGTIDAGILNVTTLNAGTLVFTSATVCGSLSIDDTLIVNSHITSVTGNITATAGNLVAGGSITGGAGSLTSLNMNSGNISSINVVSATDVIAGVYLQAPNFYVDATSGLVQQGNVTICSGSLITEIIQPGSSIPDIGTGSNRYGTVYGNIFNAATAVVTGGLSITGSGTVNITTSTLISAPSAALTIGGALSGATSISTSGNITSDHINPNANNTYDFGGTSLRWKKVWATDVDISGTFSASTISATDVIAGTFFKAPNITADSSGLVVQGDITICSGSLKTEAIERSGIAANIGGSAVSERFGTVYASTFNAGTSVVSLGVINATNNITTSTGNLVASDGGLSISGTITGATTVGASGTITGGAFSTTGTIVSDTHTPNANNLYDQGSTSLRWKKIWAVDVDISSTFSAFAVSGTDVIAGTYLQAPNFYVDATSGLVVQNDITICSGTLKTEALEPTNAGPNIGGSSNRYGTVYATTVNVSSSVVSLNFISATNNITTSTGNLVATAGGLSIAGTITGATTITATSLSLSGVISGATTIGASGTVTAGGFSSLAGVISGKDIIAGTYLQAPNFYVDGTDGLVMQGDITVCSGTINTEALLPTSAGPNIGGSGSGERYGTVYATTVNVSSSVVSLNFISATNNITTSTGSLVASAGGLSIAGTITGATNITLSGSIIGHLNPSVTNTYTLGSSTSVRWKKLWAVDADISGTVTASVHSGTDIIAGTFFKAPNITADSSGLVVQGDITICSGSLKTEAIERSGIAANIGGSAVSERFGTVYASTFNAGTSVVSLGVINATTNITTSTGNLVASSGGLSISGTITGATTIGASGTVTAGAFSTSGTIVSDTHTPNANNLYDQGSTSLRWKKIWAVDVDISSTFSASAVSGTDVIAGTYLQAPGFYVDGTDGLVMQNDITICNGTLKTEALEPTNAGPNIGGSSNRYGTVYATTVNVNSSVVSTNTISATNNITTSTGNLVATAGGLSIAGTITGATTIGASGAISGASLSLSGTITGATTIGASGTVTSGGFTTVLGVISGKDVIAGTFFQAPNITADSSGLVVQGDITICSGSLKTEAIERSGIAANIGGSAVSERYATVYASTFNAGTSVVSLGSINATTNITTSTGNLVASAGGLSISGTITGATTISASSTITGGAFSTTGTIVSDTHTPNANNTYNQGSSGLRWATVYGVAGNFSGTVTAGVHSGTDVIAGTYFQAPNISADSSGLVVQGDITICSGSLKTEAIERSGIAANIGGSAVSERFGTIYASTFNAGTSVVSLGTINATTNITTSTGNLVATAGGLSIAGSITGVTTISASGNITTTGNVTGDHIFTNTNNTYDIGTSGVSFKDIYTYDLHANADVNVTGNVNANGGITVGSGKELIDIEEVTGTFGGSPGLSTGSYPSGFTYTNCYVLSALGFHGATSDWTDFSNGSESVALDATNIRVIHTNTSFNGQSWKMLLVRV